MFVRPWITAALVVFVAGYAFAQDPAKPTERPTGLPSAIEWTFNVDAAWGAFGFGNSLFTDPKEDVRVDWGSHWFEAFVRPALSGVYKLPNSSELYGKASVVGERTFDSPRPILGTFQQSFGPDDLNIGWRSGTSLSGLDENAIDVLFGRAVYTIGHGFLVWDGAAEGGSRGGYWSNARKAFELAGIGRFKPRGGHTVEGFYLNKDDLPENETGSGVSGANYEYRIGETSTFGATYMRAFAKPDVRPLRDGMNIFYARAYTAPFTAVKDLYFELEYAHERNEDLLRSDGWSTEAAYILSKVAWSPKLSYRYAFFEGDNPATAINEAFDPLFLGFYDWSTWWQGEIAGEYFLVNSNLKSHVARVHVAPTSKLGAGVIYYKFLNDVPASFGPNVTSHDIAFEVDGYADWKFNENFTLTLTGAFANPGPAVEQSSGRTANFRYGMVFIAYSY